MRSGESHLIANERKPLVSLRRARTSKWRGPSCRIAAVAALLVQIVSCTSIVSTESDAQMRYGTLEWIIVGSIALITIVLSLVMASLALQASRDSPRKFATEHAGWQTAFFSSTIALFGILIAGLFVFMSFRVDREAQQAAERVAEKAAVQSAERVAEQAANEFMDQAAKRVQQLAAGLATGSMQLAPEQIDSTLIPGSSVTLSVAEGRTWVEFQPSTSKRYNIQAVSLESDVGSIDPIIYLYAREQFEEPAIMRFLVQNDDINDDNLNAQLEMDLEEDGIYYLGVESWFGARGEVEVSVSE